MHSKLDQITWLRISIYKRVLCLFIRFSCHMQIFKRKRGVARRTKRQARRHATNKAIKSIKLGVSYCQRTKRVIRMSKKDKCDVCDVEQLFQRINEAHTMTRHINPTPINMKLLLQGQWAKIIGEKAHFQPLFFLFR